MKKFVFIISIILVILILILSLQKLGIIKQSSESNINISKNSSDDFSPFKINKQVYFSGITVENTSFNDSSNWHLNISQYTDIAIYITPISSQILSSDNTVKSLYIDNISFNKKPILGMQTLYYQNPKQFANSNVLKDEKITTHLTYDILNFENEDNYDYYSTPTFFTDCSIPITLKYLNSNIVENYKLPNDQPLFFNGNILKNSNVRLNDLNCSLSFCINLTSNSDKFYKTTVNITIPLENESNNLFDSSVLTENKDTYIFKEFKK